MEEENKPGTQAESQHAHTEQKPEAHHHAHLEEHKHDEHSAPLPHHPHPETKILGRFTYGDILFLIVSLVMLSYTFGYVTQLKQIPSPLYGGDYYNGLGGVIHILDGGSILDNAQMMPEAGASALATASPTDLSSGTSGPLAGAPASRSGIGAGSAPGLAPWVPWLYHLCVAIFSRISGLSPMIALIDFGVVIEVFALAVIYLLVKELTDNQYLPALIALIYFSFGYSPILKYSYFSLFLMVPAFVLALMVFLKKPGMKSAAIAGVLLGLVGLSNTQAFFVGFLVFIAVAIAFLLPKIFDFKTRKLMLDTDANEQLKLYGVIFAIGFLLSLLFWFRPIFIYHGYTPNNIQDITSPDMTQPQYLWDGITGLMTQAFLPFRSGAMWLLSAVYLAGLYVAIKTRGRLESRFALCLFVVWLAVILHPLVTIPLLHTQMMNFLMAEQIYLPAISILLVIGLLAIEKWLQKKHAYAMPVFLALLFIIAFMAFSDYWKLRYNDSLTATGKTALADPFVQLASWVRANTGVNDVFLTDNEDGFALNALTGRKVVSYRRTHASPYIDVSQRMADEAVMAYGTNDATRNALLAKYDVKYLLWTNRWVLDEFQFDSTGHLAGFFDPLSVPDNASNKAYWDSNGVRYVEATMPFDPAPRTGVPTYSQMIAVPYNVSMEPLDPDIYSQFQLVQDFQYGGQDIFRIYRIKG